jgi:L-amino acid N-acyltransferase YncA
MAPGARRQVGSRTLATAQARVRRARPDDASAVARLLDEVAKESPLAALEAASVDPERLRLALARIGDQGVVLLAEDPTGSGLVGVLFGARGPGPARHTANLSLAVATRSRRSGVGRSLVCASADWASASSVRRLTASVASGNGAALALFAACGFAVEGRRPGHLAIGSALYDEVLFGAAVDEVRARAACDRRRVVAL